MKFKHFNTKVITKILIWIFSLFTCFFVHGFADYNDFLDNLRLLGIDVDSILTSKSIDRYELTRLLNGVNCKDCINPDSKTQYTYSAQRRNNFANQDGSAFGDISYLGGNYKGQSYYYCVAYVGDNSWMRGYPSGVSPICNGKFCGTRTTTVGEFLQVVLNIADQYVYKKYLVDWSKVKSWMDSLPKGSYADTYLTNQEKFLINQYASEKKQGVLPTEESLQPYIKYCMFNLDECGMQSFGVVGQGYWPVAELNILYDNNIVEYEKFEDGQTNQLVDGKYVLETLYNLFQIIDCSFNYDYDCDGIKNKNDNCPNDYNPHQTDTDHDGIGDVCDDDIDGDGVHNPIGIVDDLGNVIISKYKKGMDNCLFTANTKQTDSNQNGFGDACDNEKINLGMYIKTSNIKSTAPVTVEFQAVTEGEVKGEIQWKFGDGSTAQGRKVSHTFEDFGLYTVQATAEGNLNNAKASTTIFIGKNPVTNYALQINTNKQKINAGEDITFSLNRQGDFDNFQRSFDGGTIVEKSNSSDITKVFKEDGTYMVTVKGFKDGKIVAVANTIIGVGKTSYGTKLNLSTVNQKKGEKLVINTKLEGFSTGDIANISRDFGNQKISNNNTTIQYTYEKEGIYVIMQTITLKDGSILENFATIYVNDPNINNSYAIQTELDHLVANSTDKIGFTIKQTSAIPTATLVLNNYGDGYSDKTYKELNIRPKAFSHNYVPGIYNPQNTIYIDDCISLNTQSTIVIQNEDICLKAYLDGTLNQFKGDLDGDGIPDICDDDIDGDGLPNLIGIVQKDNTDLSIDENNTNISLLKLHNGICQLDNCPTISNEKQLDLNNNGWGDSCDEINLYKNISSFKNSIFYTNYNNIFNSNNGESDSDNDGIVDSLDACPELPENYNGVNDFDGCPEIGAINNCAINSYNYVNRNFSVYPTVQKNRRLLINDPISPEPSCKNDECKTICLGNVDNCDDCNGNKNCNKCKQNPELCGTWSGGNDGGIGPYTITARCLPEHKYYIRNNVTSLDFSFANTFEGDCPCKQCHRFIKDINGLISDIGNFSVCNDTCINGNQVNSGTTNEIEIINPDDIEPACTGSKCIICEGKNCNGVCVGDTKKCKDCNGDPTCELCKNNPELCGSRSGGTGPFDLTARCENDSSKIYNRYNINGHKFSFAKIFYIQFGCTDCHRFIKDKNNLTSKVGNFQVCANSGDIIDIINPIKPEPTCTGTHCNTCEGKNCNGVCVGDTKKCKDCNGDPTCELCEAEPELCGSRSGGTGPFELQARCENNSGKIYTRYNINGHQFSFANSFYIQSGCMDCKRFIKDKNNLTSAIGNFQVCSKIIDGPGPVPPCTGDYCKPTPPCTGNNCTPPNCTGDNCPICSGICVGDINDCNCCDNTKDPNCNPICKDCESCKPGDPFCGCRNGWNGLVNITARCDDNPNKKYSRSNVAGSCFSFAHIFKSKNEYECNSCHRYLTDTLNNKSNTIDFLACPDSDIIIYNPTKPEPICTGDACNTCEGKNCKNLCVGNTKKCKSCNGDTTCELCEAEPKLCGSRSGGTGPFELQARCENNSGKIYTRYNINGHQFSFANSFYIQSGCMDCKRFVKDKNNLTSLIGNFQVCAGDIDGPGPVPPCTGNCNPTPPIPPCSGDNCCIGDNCPNPTPSCTGICVGDASECNCCDKTNDPNCNPICENCESCKEGDPFCGCRNGWNGLVNITARCDDNPNSKYYWNNIAGSCFSFAHIFKPKNNNECNSCHRYLTDKLGKKSNTNNFQVCPHIIDIIDPERPEPTCTGTHCNTCEGKNCNGVCVGDTKKCKDCNGDPTCELCEAEPELCGSRSGGTGPFELQARCEGDTDHHIWTNIIGTQFSFANIWTGECPCKQCQRFIKDSEGLTSTTGQFQVCADSCNVWIEPEEIKEPITPINDDDENDDDDDDNDDDDEKTCSGDVEKCPCSENPNCPNNKCNKDCNECEESANWTGTAKGPYTVTARCDDDSQNKFIRSGIQTHCFSFSNKFEGYCEKRYCHRYVSAADGTTSKTTDFTIDSIKSEKCDIIPEGPDPISGCEENCNETCEGNISECPCENNPNCSTNDCNNDQNCKDCSNSKFAARRKTSLIGPFKVTAMCPSEQKSYTRTNITKHCLGFNNIFEGSCPCETCYRYVSTQNGKTSVMKEFKVCGKDCEQHPEDPDNPNPIISNGPEGPVNGCGEGEKCNTCTGDITECNIGSGGNSSGDCNGDTICQACAENPQDCGTRSGGTGPYTVVARCEPDNTMYTRYNITGFQFPFTNYFQESCPCKQCHRIVEDSKGQSSEIRDFEVCKEECSTDDDEIENPNFDIPNKNTPITTPECLSCPCNYTDFGNTLNINDNVKAILWDFNMNYLYSESIPVGIMQYLN